MGCGNSKEDINAPIDVAVNTSPRLGSPRAGSPRPGSGASTPTPMKKDRLTANVVLANKDRDIKEFYIIHHKKVLGSGLTGQVKSCTHRITKIEYALKTVAKTSMHANQIVQLRDEVEVMAELDHPNIIRIHEFFENEDKIYLVMDLCKGGELLNRLNKQKGNHFRERDACRIVQTMLSAIKYCHAHNIIHRDLKLENFLFETEDEDSELKLIDFGFSHFLSEEVVHINSVVGTAYYVAPEVLDGNYNVKCDIWSIGVITYMLLSGFPPFDGGDDMKTIELVRFGAWEFTQEFNRVSEEAKDFILKCLTIRPGSRPTAAAALKHPWFKKLTAKSEKVVDNNLQVISRLQGFVKRNVFQKICMDVVAHTLLPAQVEDLRQEFNKLNTTKSGEITKKELSKLVKKHPEIDVDFDQLFTEINIEKSGKIGYHEFLAATINRKSITEANMRAAFEIIANRKEVITKADIISLIGNDSRELNVDDVLKEAGLLEETEIDYKKFMTLLLGADTPMRKEFSLHKKDRILSFYDPTFELPKSASAKAKIMESLIE